MTKEKKDVTSMRLSSIAKKIIAAEIADKVKKNPKGKKPSGVSVIEEALIYRASKDPARRELLIAELRKDPQYAILVDLLTESKNKTGS